MAGLRPRPAPGAGRVDPRVPETAGRAWCRVAPATARRTAAVDGETPHRRARLRRSPARTPRGQRRISRLREARVLQLGKPNAPALEIDGAATVEAVSGLQFGDVRRSASPEHLAHGGTAAGRGAPCGAVAARRINTGPAPRPLTFAPGEPLTLRPASRWREGMQPAMRNGNTTGGPLSGPVVYSLSSGGRS